MQNFSSISLNIMPARAKHYSGIACVYHSSNDKKTKESLDTQIIKYHRSQLLNSL